MMRTLFIVSVTVASIAFGVFVVTSPLSFANHDPNVLHACILKATGIVRIVSSPSNCNPLLENAIQWNIVGPPGMDGQDGEQGPPGMDGSPDTPDQVREKFFAGESCGDPNMVKIGPICVDKYEAQVVNSEGNPVDAMACSANGNDCSDPMQPGKMIFARSAPGVLPSFGFTWFQAQQACFNVGKRLLTNAEWQGAAAGTPDDSASCNTSTLSLENTDAREATCVSNWGVVNMVGNLWEWVGGWIQGNTIPFAPSTGTAGNDYGNDIMFGTNPAQHQGINSTNFPAALLRGGDFNIGAFAGVFALLANDAPSNSNFFLGFRCAR